MCALHCALMMKIALSLFCCLVWTAAARADAVRLQIVGPDKKPVAGAQVRVTESSGAWEERKMEAPLELVSDEAGTVAFESKSSLAAPPKDERLAAPTAVFARILVPGMVVATQNLVAGDNEIALQAAQTWGGVALDEEQKPVAGVKIVLSGFSADGGGKSTALGKSMQLETTTGEDGKWSFSNVPRAGTARVGVEDPRFVRETLNLSLAAAAPPVFLERGATIKGRLLTPDGTPAAGVPLHPGGSSGYISADDFRTAPNGTFVLTGLRPGDFYLQSINFGRRDKPLPFLIEPKNVKALKTGEVRDIGDWKTEIGILVKGKVVESGANTPIAQANISLYGRGNGRGTSDKNGEFSFRASEDASQGSISAQGFGQLQKPVPTAVNGVIDLGTIELKRGIEAKGTLKDKNGRGVGGLQVYAEKGRGGRQYGYANPNGNFSFGALEAGDYTLKLEGAKLVSEVKFSVVAGQKTAPIEAVVDTEGAADTPKTVAGRALDNAGNPVAGAKIALRISSGHSSQSLNTISGIDGAFEAKFSIEGATPKIGTVTRPGLIFARGGDFKVVDGAWRADLIFQPRGAALRGRVVDAQGKPVRAFVSLAGRNDQPIVQSDANGDFSIPDVALEGVTLVASNGGALGEARIEKAGENGSITLPRATPYDAAALADEILPNARLGYLYGERWGAIWDALGTQRLEAAITRAGQGGPGSDWTWTEYLRQLARRDPKDFLARGGELVARVSKTNLEAPALLAALRAKSDDPAERELARAWLETQNKATRALDANGVTSLLRLSTVSEALQAGEGAKQVDFAAQIAAQLTDKARAAGAEEWGRIAAPIGTQAFDNLILDWGANAKLRAFGGAVRALSQAGDLAGAREMLKRMEAVLPAAEAAKDEVRVEGYAQKPKEMVAQARGELALALAKTDPQAALELSKDVAEYRQSEILLEIGRNAARLGQTEIAARALREVFEARYSNIEPGAAAAQIALGFDPKLADELFQMTFDKAQPRGSAEDFGYRPSIAAYASARANRWAGESRILVEREWADRIKAYKPPENNDYDNAIESLKALVGAMAKVDARRALEMVEQLPEKGNARAEARGRIAVALLAKD